MKMFIYVLFLISLPIFAQDREEFLPVEYPKNYVAHLNVVYTKVGNWEGKMDIYKPSDSSTPTAVVINIHGGAWTHGAKESQRGFGSFFKNGWAVANIEYRMSSVAPAPAAIEDARCALIYLIKNSKEINIDFNKIVVMGGSAGGHLALMAGLLGNYHTFDKNCTGIENISVAAIIDKYGVADLSSSRDVAKSKSARAWLAENIDSLSFLKAISPIAYVTKKSPPVFIVHGDADPTVPFQQSVELKKKLDEAGVKNVFITVEGGKHGKFSEAKNKEISTAMWKFFEDIGLVKSLR
jgi:acetyl esterase/lipase